MDDITLENQNTYDDPNETTYLAKPQHKIRSAIVEDIIKNRVSELKNQSTRILSVACGNGELEDRLLEDRSQVFGLDIALQGLYIAKRRGIRVVQANVAKIFPFKDQVFDIVFAGEIIEHLMHTKTFLTQIHRVLKPSGFFVLTTPNLARLQDRISFLFGYPPRHTSPTHRYLYLHIRPFTLISIRKSLQAFGFEIIDTVSNYVTYRLDDKILLKSRVLAKIIPSLGDTLIITATKT